jgi:hypothetical protein
MGVKLMVTDYWRSCGFQSLVQYTTTGQAICLPGAAFRKSAYPNCEKKSTLITTFGAQLRKRLPQERPQPKP